jgi:hypothetical protein
MGNTAKGRLDEAICRRGLPMKSGFRPTELDPPGDQQNPSFPDRPDVTLMRMRVRELPMRRGAATTGKAFLPKLIGYSFRHCPFRCDDCVYLYPCGR